MTNVSKRPAGAIDLPVPADLADPTSRAAWMTAMRAQTADLIAAGLDATAPPGRRDLGRRAARRIITEATGAIERLFGEAGLDAERGAS